MYIIEQNPNMDFRDIRAILDAAKQSAQNDDDSPEWIGDCDSSNVNSGDLNEQELDDMSDVLFEING